MREYTVKDLKNDIKKYIYDKSKAKIFNILESQIDNEKRLEATKHITLDVINNISKNTVQYFLNDNIEIHINGINISCDTCSNNREVYGCYYKNDNENTCLDNDFQYWQRKIK